MKKPNNTTPAPNSAQATARANALYYYNTIKALEKAPAVLRAYGGKVINKRLTDALQEATGTRFYFDDTYCLLELYVDRETVQYSRNSKLGNGDYTPIVYPSVEHPARIYAIREGGNYENARNLETGTAKGESLRAEEIIEAIEAHILEIEKLFTIEKRASTDAGHIANIKKLTKAREYKRKAGDIYYTLPSSFRNNNNL